MSEAGWYPNPADPLRTRYWTGNAWTVERFWTGTQWQDVAAPPQPVQAQPVYAPAEPLQAQPVYAPAEPLQAQPVQAQPVYAPVQPAPYDEPQYQQYAAPPGYPSAAAYPAAPAYAGTPGPTKAAMTVGVRNRTLLTLGGAALIVIGVLLPYATQNNGVSTTTISGTDRGGGQLSIVLGLAIAVLAALFLNRTIGRRSAIATLILGLIAVIICGANMANISDVMDQEKTESAELIRAGGGTQFGAGLFVVFTGCALVIIGSLLTLVAARRRRAG